MDNKIRYGLVIFLILVVFILSICLICGMCSLCANTEDANESVELNDCREERKEQAIEKVKKYCDMSIQDWEWSARYNRNEWEPQPNNGVIVRVQDPNSSLCAEWIVLINGKVISLDGSANMWSGIATYEEPKENDWLSRRTPEERRLKEAGFTPPEINRIISGEIRIGDTKEFVIESWGKPKDINKTITAYGASEQWVYGLGCYVYFNNEVVTCIQD